MTNLLPQNVFPSGLGFSEDQVHDAFYIAYRSARAIGVHGHGPKVVSARWDLDRPYGRTVIRCIFVVKEVDYRFRYATHDRRLRVSTFDLDRALLEAVVRDALEARAVTFDTLYIGIALGDP